MHGGFALVGWRWWWFAVVWWVSCMVGHGVGGVGGGAGCGGWFAVVMVEMHGGFALVGWWWWLGG